MLMLIVVPGPWTFQTVENMFIFNVEIDDYNAWVSAHQPFGDDGRDLMAKNEFLTPYGEKLITEQTNAELNGGRWGI